MKYGASSSLLILDYVPEKNKFKVIRRIEVPKSEYSFDKAVNMIIELNKIYSPSFIYVDRGSGEYQLEMLHKYGDEHPESGLKNKVKGFQFSQKIDVMDPIKKTTDSKPMKPFMVNQLSLAIEREQLILSPFDETLHKQLVDYEVVRMSANGQPVFTSVNEHFVDALGLAFLAFALEFPDIAGTIEKVDFTTNAVGTDSPFAENAERLVSSVQGGFGSVRNAWTNLKNGSISYEDSQDPREVDGPKYFQISATSARRNMQRSNWGSRGFRGGFGGRSMF